MRTLAWLVFSLCAAMAAPAHATSWQALPTALDIGGETGNRRTLAAALSTDGRFALVQSEASDIGDGVEGFSGGLEDVYVYDAQNDSLELISHWSLEPLAKAGGLAGGMSDDGRFVLYESPYPALTRPQTWSSFKYLYLHDRQTGYVQQVSHAAANRDLAVQAHAVDISADGRWILFYSSATNLVDGFLRGGSVRDQLYLYDRDSAVAVLVSHRHDGAATACNSAASNGRLSRDGRRVVYSSACSDIVAMTGIGAAGDDVYLYDRETHANRLVSHAVGEPNRGGSGAATVVGVSADGGTVAYSTRATDVQVGTDSNGGPDLYLFDADGSTHVLASRSGAAPAQAANRSSTFGRLSADGQFLLFETAATDLDGAPQDVANTRTDVFVFDRAAANNTLVSHAAGDAATPANAASSVAWIAPDGSRVIFRSSARDLVAGATSPVLTTSQLFVRDMASGETSLVSHREGEPLAAANVVSSGVVATPDAARVLFDTMATDVKPGLADDNGQYDAFVLDRTSGAMHLVSRSNPTTALRTPNFELAAAAVSDDGRHVLLRGSSTNFLEGFGNRRFWFTFPDGFDVEDIYLLDRLTGESLLVNHMKDVPGMSVIDSVPVSAVMSRDGRFVAFAASTSEMWDAGTSTTQVFLFDREQRAQRIVTHPAGAPHLAATGVSQTGPMTPDGRWVTYASEATNLETGQNDFGSTRDVFVYDSQADTSHLMTRRMGASTLANGPSSPRGISDDGTWILFQTAATNLIPGVTDPNFGGNDIYLRHRVDGTMVLVSRSVVVPTRTSSGSSNALALSGDGRYVVFSSSSTDLVSGLADANGTALDLFIFDRVEESTRLVTRSRDSATTTLGAASTFAQASRDGRFVLFRTVDPAVTENADTNAGNDVFLFDAVSGEIELVSRGAGGGTPSMASDQPMMSEDGRLVAYRSAAPDVATGATDTNAATDVFQFDRQTQRTTLLSHLPQDAAASLPRPSSPGAMSADGRMVLLNTDASSVVTGLSDSNSMGDAFAMIRGAIVRWTAEGDGRLEPAGERFVADGEGTSFQVIAGPGFKLAAIDGCDGMLAGGTFAIAVVNDDCVVEASFLRFHMLTYRAGAGGQVVGASTQEVFDGDDGAEVVAQPLPGFTFMGWSDGSAENPRIDEDVAAALDVEALFHQLPDAIFASGFE